MKKRITTLVCIACLSVGLASGAAFTLRTIALYSGACNDLDGFAGLLQSAGFVPRGKCKTDIHGACVTPQACVVNGVKGHCVSEVVNHKTYCICKPKPVSP